MFQYFSATYGTLVCCEQSLLCHHLFACVCQQFQIISTSSDVSAHVQGDIGNCYSCRTIGRFICYFEAQALAVCFNFHIGLAVYCVCCIVFKCIVIESVDVECELQFFVGFSRPQTFFSFLNNDVGRNLCVSVVDDQVVSLCFYCVRRNKFSDCNFLFFIESVATQCQLNIACETGFSNQCHCELQFHFFLICVCTVICCYKCLSSEFKVLFFAFLVSVCKCCVNINLVICQFNTICTCYVNICCVNTIRQCQCEGFLHIQSAFSCFFQCDFQRFVIGIICDTIVVYVNAAVDYGYIFIFVNFQSYDVINNLSCFYCISCCFEGVCYAINLQRFYCNLSNIANLSIYCFDFDIVFVDCNFIATIECRS